MKQQVQELLTRIDYEIETVTKQAAETDALTKRCVFSGKKEGLQHARRLIVELLVVNLPEENNDGT